MDSSKELVPIFDGHNDTVHLMRDYCPDGIDFMRQNSVGHLDLPRARTGGLIGGFFALWVPAEHPREGDLVHSDSSYSIHMADPLDPDYAIRSIAAQIAAMQSLIARSGRAMTLAKNTGDILKAKQDRSFVVLLHMEGAEAIGPTLTELENFYVLGLRSLGPVWSRPNIFGHGVPFAFPSSPDTGPGLTSAGLELIRTCNRMGILIDLSHMNEQGFWDVARTSTAPLVATHTAAHALCPSARNLMDRQLDAIRDSNGIVGLNFCVNDLRPDANRNADVPLDNLIHQVRYLVDRLGIDRVALGSDFDGATIPSAIGDASRLQNLISALRTSGFDEPSINKVAHENWIRVLRLSID